MTYILLIVISSNTFISIDHVEFNNKKACEEAQLATDTIKTQAEVIISTGCYKK